MDKVLSKCASLQFGAGIARYLNDEMRVYSSVAYRGSKRRIPFNRRDEYYWIVRAATNHLLQLAGQSDFVVGIAVVTTQGIKLSAFNSQFELVKQVDRSDGSASYMFCATKARDDDMGDIWVVKVVQEVL